MKYDSQKIIYKRRIKGWGQKDLARESGVGICTINRIEKGHTKNPTRLKRVADTLGIPMEELLSL